MPSPSRHAALLCLAFMSAGCSSGSGKTVTLTDKNFEEKVLNSKQVVLVDFWADWCAPCKSMDPVIRELAAEFEGKAVVGKLDGDANRSIVEKYEIDAFPTFLIFKGGELKRRVRGAVPKMHLSDLLAALQ
jgi:thioredoxin 1